MSLMEVFSLPVLRRRGTLPSRLVRGGSTRPARASRILVEGFRALTLWVLLAWVRILLRQVLSFEEMASAPSLMLALVFTQVPSKLITSQLPTLVFLSQGS